MPIIAMVSVVTYLGTPGFAGKTEGHRDFEMARPCKQQTYTVFGSKLGETVETAVNC